MKRDGFSLIEIVAVLVLTGILAAVSGLFLAPAVNRYQVERAAVGENQNMAAALSRLGKEWAWADRTTVNVGDGGRTVSWESVHPEPSASGIQTVRWPGTAGDALLMNGQPFLRGVDNFGVSGGGAAGYLEVSLKLSDRSDLYQTRIYFREGLE